MTTLEVALVDDWELRGDGGGDPRILQFATLRKPLALYERLGFRRQPLGLSVLSAGL